MVRPDLPKARRYVRALHHLDRAGIKDRPWRRHLVETIDDQMQRMTLQQAEGLVEYAWHLRGVTSRQLGLREGGLT